jgi:hypothetical protein
VRARPFGCHILAEFAVPSAPMLGGHNIFLRFTAVTPERKGYTRTPVLRRGGRTARGVVPGVDRVQSAGVMQIHRPLLLDEWGGLEGAFRSTVPRSEGLGR